MPESAPRPGTGRVLDGLTFIVAFVAAIVAVAMVVAVIIGPVSAGGDRAAPAERTSSRTTGTSGPTAVPSGSVALAPATPSPTVTPSQAPAIVAMQYLSGGHTYAGLEVRSGTVVTAALDGAVEVRTYQLIDGSVRVGSNVPSLPFYPYITVVSPDSRMTYRPGALGSDVEVLVADGQQIRVGGPLFRQLGPGRSSWATFYDPGAPFQVVVSVQAVPSGRDLDPLSFF
jgi:hypothetical protein